MSRLPNIMPKSDDCEFSRLLIFFIYSPLLLLGAMAAGSSLGG